MTSKCIITDLNIGEKHNDDNCDIWSRKIWYVLEEKNALEGIHNILNQLEEGNSAQHLRVMSNMIAQLKSAGHVLSDEQQLQAVIRSLPNNCEHLKVKLTHNDNIKAFFDVARHVELEDEHLGTVKTALLMPLRQSQVVQNLQVSNARKLEKKWERQRDWRRTL